MARDSRKTKQKELIQQELDKLKTFFSAEELHNKIKKKNSKVSIATIYRFLKSLKDNYQLYSYTCDRRTVYSKETKSHCHFTCERTGEVTHFVIDNLDFLKNKIPGKITSFQLEVKGICEKCKRK